MALSTDQKRQLLLEAKKKNPALTREDAVKLLGDAETLTPAQPQPRPKQDVSQYIVPEGSTDPNPVMKLLAGVQGALGKGGRLSAVIPVVYGLTGTVLGGAGGGPAGAVVGGAAGAATGERLQQLLDPSKAFGAGGEAGQNLSQGKIFEGIVGERDDQNEALKQGAISALLDVTTMGAGKLLKPVGSVAKSAFGKEALERGYQEAFTIPRALSGSIRFPKAVKELIDYGIGGKSIQEFGDIASKVTGETGVLPAAVREGLSSVDNVVMDVADNEVIEAMAKARKSATNVQKSVLDRSESEIMNTLTNGGQVGYQTKPLEVFDAIQSLEKKGHALLSQTERSLTDSASNIALEQQAQLYLRTADTLKDKLFSDKVISKEVIDSLKTPERIAVLESVSPKLAEQFKKATSLADLRRLQSPFVSLSTAVQSTLDSSNSAFSNLSKSMTGQGGSGILSVTGIPQALSMVKGAVESPQMKTGAAVLPQKVGQALSPENIISGLRSAIKPQSPTVGGTTKEAILQLLRSQLQ